MAVNPEKPTAAEVSNEVLTSDEKMCHSSGHSSDKPIDVSGYMGESIHSDQHILNLLNRMDEKLDNVLSRISVLENTVLKKLANQSSYEKPIDMKKIDRLNIFMKSNSLPTKIVAELDKFEEKLDDSTFFDASVSVLIKFAPKN